MTTKTPPSHAAQEKEAQLPPTPLTIEGSAVLHQMFRIRWEKWKGIDQSKQKQIIDETVNHFRFIERPGTEQSAMFSLLGHKGDLMIVHFRRSLDSLSDAELQLSALRFSDFLDCTTSYLSVVELGLYEATVELYERLFKQNIEPGSDNWKVEVEKTLSIKREALETRIWPSIPERRYLSFYPMDKKRGETTNWYKVPIKQRQQMMRDHGLIGRRYAGKVNQIITGSVGFDDWEWGVDLFADDPLVFKNLVYEMRFDEASAGYGLFGSFYIGLRFQAVKLHRFLQGHMPEFPGK